MYSRFFLISAVSVAFFSMTTPAFSQLKIETARERYQVGDKSLMLGQSVVNSTSLPITYSTYSSGQVGQVWYEFHRLAEDNSVNIPTFKVRLNNAEILEARYLNYFNTTGSYAGTIGPLKTATIGQTVGCATPVNLLHGVPNDPFNSSSLVLSLNDGSSRFLFNADQLEILTPGTYQAQLALSNVEVSIGGFNYTPGDYITAIKYITINPREQN